jgi:hypothetical protein
MDCGVAAKRQRCTTSTTQQESQDSIECTQEDSHKEPANQQLSRCCNPQHLPHSLYQQAPPATSNPPLLWATVWVGACHQASCQQCYAPAATPQTQHNRVLSPSQSVQATSWQCVLVAPTRIPTHLCCGPLCGVSASHQACCQQCYSPSATPQFKVAKSNY